MYCSVLVAIVIFCRALDVESAAVNSQLVDTREIVASAILDENRNERNRKNVDVNTTNSDTSSNGRWPNSYCETNITEDCPSLCGNFDGYSQSVFLDRLLHPCRYDNENIPTSNTPLEVNVQVEVSYTEVKTLSQIFITRLQVTLNYVDSRLRFHELSPSKPLMVGEESLGTRIWTPHIYTPGGKDSAIMGLDKKDIFVSISPYGEVILNKRIFLTNYCWMNLLRFPFDVQVCSVEFQIWSHNISQLVLKWNKIDPLILNDQLHIPEFDLIDYKVDEVWQRRSSGVSDEKYSSLRFEFKISRQMGYYILDFFVPSILLVATSWVSFWLQADATPARVALGTSTMLTFITLTLGLYSNFPKVPYVTLGEIWYIGCVVFIFASIAEFAFANVIWRRKKQVELLKSKSRYILKSALTPRLARKDVLNTLSKSQSCSSLTSSIEERSPCSPIKFIKSSRSISVPSKHIQNGKAQDEIHCPVTVQISRPDDSHNSSQVIQMSPQEVAIWLDRKSRIYFPCVFILFNLIYWLFVLLT